METVNVTFLSLIIVSLCKGCIGFQCYSYECATSLKCSQKTTEVECASTNFSVCYKLTAHSELNGNPSDIYAKGCGIPDNVNINTSFVPKQLQDLLNSIQGSGSLEMKATVNGKSVAQATLDVCTQNLCNSSIAVYMKLFLMITAIFASLRVA